MNKVLIVATSRKTRGGISAVIEKYRQTPFWEKNNCVWIEDHIDRNAFLKIWYFIKGFVTFLFQLPKARIVHFHFSYPLREVPFLFAAKLAGKRVISHLHACSAEDTIEGPRSSVYKYFFSRSDLVIVLSEYWEDKVKALVGEKPRVAVLYNPCEEVKNVQKEKKECVILYAGSVIPRKGYETLIRAFAQAKDQCPGWRVELAGNGEIERAKEIAEEEGVSEVIRCLGWVRDEAKDAAFSRASIFCLPSYAEGFPMAVLDAFSYGLPVITTPVGGIPDVAMDGENMLLFEPGNISELAQKIVALASNQELMSKLSAESVRLAKDVFSIQAACNVLQGYYDSLAA